MNDTIRFFLHKMVSGMSLSHRNLINLLAKLGYSVDPGGMCFGPVGMALQAFFAGDIDTFDRRINKLGAELKNISVDALAIKIKNIEAKRVTLIKHYRAELLLQLNSQCELDLHMSDQDFYALLRQNARHPAIVAFKEKIKKIEKIWNADESDLLDVHAFLEGVALYYSPGDFPELFDPLQRPQYQNADLTFTRVLPEKLMEVKSTENKTSDATKRKLNIVEKPLVKQVAKHVDVYSLVDLIFNFAQLEKLSPTAPLGMILASYSHVITVCYDPLKKEWLLIDANDLPSKRYKTREELATQVFASFEADKFCALSSTVYSVQEDADFLKSKLSAIKKSAIGEVLFSEQKMQYLISSPELALDLFCISAKENKVDYINLLMSDKYKIDPNKTKFNGKTPLFDAANKNNFEVVKALLECKNPKVDPNKVELDGATPLYVAAQNGYVEVVRALLACKDPKVDPNVVYLSGATPLYVAAQNGYIDVVNALLESKEHKVDSDKARPNGITPLYIAAEKGHTAVVKALLKSKNSKVDPDRAVKIGMTALYIAAYYGHDDVVKALLESQDPKVNPDKANDNGETPLYAAAQKGHVAVVKALLGCKNSKIDLNKAKYTGETPLCIAVQMGNVDIVKMLVKHRANLNIPIQANCQSLLKIAAGKRREHAVHQLFIEKGIGIFTAIKNFTPLHVAIFFGHSQIVKKLIAAGANIHAKTEGGISMLDLARAMDYPDMIKQLNYAMYKYNSSVTAVPVIFMHKNIKLSAQVDDFVSSMDRLVL